jgi:hypothetical protein
MGAMSLFVIAFAAVVASSPSPQMRAVPVRALPVPG